jgi:hypothetical protein
MGLNINMGLAFLKGQFMRSGFAVMKKDERENYLAEILLELD